MRHFFLIGLCVFIISCADNKTEAIPNNVLPKEKMAEVLVDIHLLEATLNNTGSEASLNSIIRNADSTNTNILKKHSVTKTQYQESFYFYSSNPKILAEVYNIALNQLSTLQAETLNNRKK